MSSQAAETDALMQSLLTLFHAPRALLHSRRQRATARRSTNRVL
jgi:hypothetical protein